MWRQRRTVQAFRVMYGSVMERVHWQTRRKWSDDMKRIVKKQDERIWAAFYRFVIRTNVRNLWNRIEIPCLQKTINLLTSLKTIGFQRLSPFMGSPMDKQFPAAEVLMGRMLCANGPVYTQERHFVFFFLQM